MNMDLNKIADEWFNACDRQYFTGITIEQIQRELEEAGHELNYFESLTV